MISVIIPCYNDQIELERCIKSLSVACYSCPCDVEIVPSIGVTGVGRARNEGAKKAKGDILVFVDADCTVSKGFLKEIYEKSLNPYFVGGGSKFVHLDKLSLGRLLFLIPLGLFLYFKRISVGAFWIRKEVFNRLSGFREIPFEDIDFALRLKDLAKTTGTKFESIKKNYIVWNTRSFDKYGEWHWLKGYKVYMTPTIR